MLFYSEFQQSYLWLPLVGLIVGLLASMIGSGGGFFFPLVLILLFQTPAQIAVATSLAATLPLCIVGSLGHYRRGNIHFRLVIVFGIAGILGAITGTAITRLLAPEQLKTSFGIYSILLALLIIINSLKGKRNKTKENETTGKISSAKITGGTAYGFSGGIISGAFGTSGAAPVLAGLVALRTPIRLVAGTSLLVVLINTVSALAGHFLIGEIDMTLVLFLTAGTVIGAFAGPRLLAGITLAKSEYHIRQLFAFIMIVLGIILIIS